jgi:hypothetical protein
MATPDHSPWHGTTSMAIGRALLDADEAGLTAGELASATGKDQSNLKKRADELVEEKVLQRLEPVSSNGAPGRPARSAFTFSDGERERFEDLVDVDVPLGLLKTGQQIVCVDISDQLERLSTVLSQAGIANGSQWVATTEGGSTELVLVFEGATAVNDSLDLMAILSDAELKARRASIAKIGSTREEIEAARKRKRRLDRSRRHRQAMQSSPRESNGERR